MKELSLNILDIAQNSIKAGADIIKIELTETANRFEICITDNGCGMKEEFVRNVTDPFTTTRTTRKVGLGIPLFKLAAEQTGGSFSISSKHESEHPQDHGTVVTAVFDPTHMDFTPLGDIASTLTILIQGSPDIHWIYTHSKDNGSVSLDTDELKAVLDDVPLDTFEVIAWIGDYIKEQYLGF
ncbi:MAG: sensor histidine kinase [Ruminococcaceae bacterium]|nr:sensor histidine kinase [Oscillospiraceae bacterium]